MIPMLPKSGAARAAATLAFAICALLLLAGPALAEEDVEDPPPLARHDFWDWWFPGHFEREARYPRRLVAPLAAGNNEFLHHLVLLPPLESFRTLRPERFSADLRFEGVRDSREGNREGNRFDASTFEAGLLAAYGLTRDFEIRIGLDFGWFRPDNDESVRLTQEGETVFPPDRFDPGPNVSHLHLGLKILSAVDPRNHLGLSTLITLKVPLAGREDFLTSGRGDVNVLFCGTGRVALGDERHLYVHLNAGVSFFDEENVFPKKVYLNPVAVYGASAVLPFRADQSFLDLPFALILQLQGHANAFRKMDILDTDPVSLHGALRVMVDSWSLDGGAGFGLNDTGAADVIVSIAVGCDF